MKLKQTAMFTQGEDLPLISNTPQRTSLEVFKPAPIARQPSLLPVACPACQDTGILDGKRCWCQVGD